jgi:hypothetical protein
MGQTPDVGHATPSQTVAGDVALLEQMGYKQVRL